MDCWIRISKKGLVFNWNRPQLFHLVTKIDAELNWEEKTKDIHSAGNAQLILKSEEGRTRILFSKRIQKEIIEDQLSKELEQLSELPMQGQLVGNQGADYLMSQNVLRNHKLSDDFIFLVQGKAQRPSMLLYITTMVCKSISELRS